jgi:hypothetical protein
MKYLLCLALLSFGAALPSAAAAQPPAAAAQPSAADRTTARRLGIEGQVALKKGDFDTAADRFERANDLVPAPTFLVRLGHARAGQGRLVEAYEIYRRIIREGVAPDKPEPFKRALQEAQQEAKALEPRLAWVSVNVVGAPPDRVEVSLNGSVIPSAAVGAQRPVDPGALHVQAKADGYRTAEADVQLTEGQHLPAIELHMVPVPKPTPLRPEVAEQQPVMSADGGTGGGWAAQSTVGYVTLGLGGVALGVWSVTGIIAINQRNEISTLTKGCDRNRQPGECYVHDPDGTLGPKVVHSLSNLRKFADVATVSVITGGVLVAAGMTLLMTAPDESSKSVASIQPYVGIGSVGAVGTF